ncbi:hypothetical protein BDV33DRAFT_211091 [Aspergillus novoparasiticus]|uniref:Uncharacterized protein n=1 Tax=Aspergillus novoparasiticus TaxID=986946 RepID=A0A5N6E793_9EURO|nr:hypothetical protein BDV33DRAFT_211091 [Aspergillus novoparasiticus]
MNEDSVFLPSAFVQNLAVHNVRIKQALPQLMPSIYYLEAAGQPTATKLLMDSTGMKTVHWPQTTCSLGNSNDVYKLYGYYSAEAIFGLWHNRDQFYYQLRAVAPAAIFGALVGMLTSLAVCCLYFLFMSCIGYVELRRQTHQHYLRRALYWSDEKASLV